MADKKITELTIGIPAGTDLIPFVSSPGGSPVTKKTLVSSLQSMPEGTMINGRILPSVASNNLTLALKTFAGGNPSASDPVLVVIGGVVRSITAALSVTKNAGTNWCNAGGAELATKETDFFVYLGYNATDGVVIGFSRIPYGTLYSSFSATSTSDKYCAISTITNAAAGDYYTNIGRFAATLSAGAGYTWTVPTFTNANLIQRPIFNSRPLTWTPTYTNLTVGNGTTVAYYQIIGSRCYAQNSFVFGSTSSVSGLITQTLPMNRTTTYYGGGGAGAFIGLCRISDTGSAIYDGVPLTAAATTAYIYAKGAAGTYANLIATSATVPMTWTTTDALDTWLEYQLAEQ